MHYSSISQFTVPLLQEKSNLLSSVHHLPEVRNNGWRASAIEKPIVEPPKSIEQVDFSPTEAGQRLDKALRDSDEASSVSYASFAVGFPKDSHQKLADSQQQILDYRSWATLTWWNVVSNHASIPQGTDRDRLWLGWARWRRWANSIFFKTPGSCFVLRSSAFEDYLFLNPI